MKTTEKRNDVLQAVERILDNYLEMNKHRKTPERYAILKAVYSMDSHFTLDELGDKLTDEYQVSCIQGHALQHAEPVHGAAAGHPPPFSGYYEI